ncbi:hypothetical protein WJX72_008717 [[Myrmecia] bisecta]|uniref:Enoyl reductase (ER) domain-containing protein n=1 Tax=[Myrmecia] bisecta TaxID=41462 RepID=A0AAW1Q7Y9_9CHLO
MQAVVYDTPGDESVLTIETMDAPNITPSAVRISVRATAVNRADLMQRQGNYPPPPGASKILGLECVGDIVETGRIVRKWKVGDRVMALCNGGGYAEEVVVDEGSVMAVPDGMSDAEAAAFMETYLTAFLNIFVIGAPPPTGTVLIHGGGSGVGTAAITLCKLAGLTTIVTAGSSEKCRQCSQHGATHVINYKTQKFAEVVRERTHGVGANVVLDCIGGSYLADNVHSLSVDGTLVVIGLLGGAKADSLDMGLMLRKRAKIAFSTLRNRTDRFKADLIRHLQDMFGEELSKGQLKPVVDVIMPLADVADAHRRMAASEHFGKIVLAVQQPLS